MGLPRRLKFDASEILFTRDERSHYRLYRAPLQANGTAGDQSR
jgi:hypothetical protein